MLTEEQYFGGSSLIGNATSATLPVYGSRFVRVVDSFAPTTRNLTMPEGTFFTEGGPIYIISNNSGDNVSVKRSNGVTIGTVAAGSTGYVFLVDRLANAGSGEWALAGAGTSGETGDQSAPAGFNYGNGPTPKGLSRDMGSSSSTTFPTPEGDTADMDFGFAVIAAFPSVPI